ncbi:MAG: alpha-L-arabinofuranosidase [Chitinophagaceae bacterium]|jgi:alpha-L-arabinofuranosidase|nr:alpha-L-arabinofuranosidase [Chitinophagaceae bacterium]
MIKIFQTETFFKWIIFYSTLFIACPVFAQQTISVQVNQPKAKISPTMWGVFFEDINFGADGGIYAELVKNRSFEFTNPLMGWEKKGSKNVEGVLTVQNRQNTNTANPRYIQLKLQNVSNNDLGLVNEGFRGMGIKKNIRYFFSAMYRQSSNTQVKIHIELRDSSQQILGDTVFSPSINDNNWHTQSVSFLSNATCLKAKLYLWFEGNGQIDLDMISLFPSDTWKNRRGGMRADMVQMLADLKPGFIRFPGGCIVEGRDLNNRYQWKKTLGALEERQLIMNRWNVEFAHRPAPDYFQTFGLGFYEYFQLAEDIGAAPLPILNCGMACQFNSAEVAALDQIDPYVQDALDLIEFANGDTTTVWGKERAKLGHPATFNLTMMGIGNENWGPQYLERLKIFTKAIKEKYPEIKLVNSSGTDPDGERFDFLNNALRKNNADIIDEHYYRRPEWFLANANRYDNYPRNGSKVFAGEYAAQTDKTVSINNRNNWLGALSEAAFMTGLERNADVVTMASYAPLFAHADAWQWTPDLIWVNNLTCYGTPNYYVQKLFSTNKGSVVVPALLNNQAIEGQDSLYVTAAIDATANDVIVKIVNVSSSSKNENLDIQGIDKITGNITVTTLKGNALTDVNSFANPETIIPVTEEKSGTGKKININIASQSFSVIRFKYK